MKKVSVVILALLFVSSVAFADAFSPTLLTLSAASEIEYAFDGEDIDIDFDLSNYNGTVVFLITTKDKGAEIGSVRNGNMGWHEVNGIDTTVYFSAPQIYPQGNNFITWDGRNLDGNVVASDTYIYYLWAFSHDTPKVPACTVVEFSRSIGNSSEFWTVNEDRTPRTQPLLFHTQYTTTAADELSNFPFFKWNVGDDPDDVTKVETTLIPGYTNVEDCSLDPDDYNVVYRHTVNTTTNNAYINKWTWVPDDVADQDMDWGTEDSSWRFSLYNSDGYNVGACSMPSNRMLLAGEMQTRNSVSNATGVFRIDMDTGEQIDYTDLWDYMADLWIMDDGSEFWWVQGPWNCAVNDQERVLLAGPFAGSRTMVIDPYFEDSEEDMVIWANHHGDLYRERPNPDEPYPAFYQMDMYQHGFGSAGVSYTGPISFDLLSPDGTGLGFLTMYNETDVMKSGPYFISSDSAYDGIYMPNNSTMEEGESYIPWCFTPYDAIKGTLTPSDTGVEDASPSAFSVEQNSPNPCNPTTTIGFAIAEAGNVTIDVYNIAGQKVDTIVNNYMDAGSHSVVWDGSDFSAGVYFYTVKSSDFSRTMKMTLLK